MMLFRATEYTFFYYSKVFPVFSASFSAEITTVNLLVLLVRAKTTKLPHRGKSACRQQFGIQKLQHQEPGSTELRTVNNLIDSKLL